MATTIYPDVSDRRTGMKTTVYPYTMSSSDVPRAPFSRGRTIQSRGSSRDQYVSIVTEQIAGAGSYAAWLDTLELASPSTGVPAYLGLSAPNYRNARRAAQAAYDSEVGIGAAGESQVSVSDADDLGTALDAIGDQAEGLLDRAKRNPGTTAAIIGGAILLFFVARRR